MKALYITYDGLLEPLGQSQVLPYVRGLAARGVAFTVLSFEKPKDLSDAGRVAALRRELAAKGVRWRPLRYHKRPSALATAWDIGVGTLAALWSVARNGVEIVHARSYVAGVMAWLVTRVTRAAFLFDMRGFWVDERVEGGIWPPQGGLYRTAKRWERRLLRGADAVVVLAEAAMACLPELAGTGLRIPVRVVPTCTDLGSFVRRDRNLARRGLELPQDAFILVYVGSLGTWYLGPETFAFAEAVASRTDSCLFLVITRDRAEAEALVPEGLKGRVRIVSVPHGEVASWLQSADAALSFVRPTFSKRASCPTKLGEYLACGLPVVSTGKIGDVDAMLEGGAGVVLVDTSTEGLQDGAEALLALTKDEDHGSRCRTAAETWFSLDEGVERLWRLYRDLGRTS